MAVIKQEDGKVITLTEGDVFSKIRMSDKPRQYKKGEGRVGTDYWIGSFEGIGFNCEPEFKQAWAAGDIAEVNLKETTYQRVVVDPLNPRDPEDDSPAETVTAKGWQLTGFVTYEQLGKMELAVAKKTVAVKKVNLEYTILEASSMKDLKLTDEKVDALKAAI